MVAELEYVRNVRSFTVLAADGTELIHVDARAGRHPRHPADPPAARRAARRASRRAGVGARHHAAGRHRARPRRRRRRLRLAGLDRRVVAGGPGRRRRAPAVATGSSRWTSIPTDGTFADRRPRRARPARRRRRRRRHLQLVPARPTTSWSTRPTSVSTRVVEAGPVRGRLEIRRTYDAARPTPPTAPAPASQAVEVLTTLELRAGDDLVRVHVELDNHGVRDHRLRVVPPAARAGRARRWPSAPSPPSSAASSPRAAPPSRASPPTRRAASSPPAGSPSPTRGCSSTSWSTSTTTPRPAGALALTLLRCTGMLSQGPMATRPLPAGPLTPMEGPQSQHRVEARVRGPPRRARPVRGGRRPLAAAAGHPGRRARRPPARPPARRCRSAAPR